jgi:hypothetical protein
VNTPTQKVFNALKKATKDSCAGGGLSSEGSFRLLWEPDEGNNNYEGFASLFDRNELEQGYLSESAKQEFRYFDLMKYQTQNDLVAPVHRDMVMRYSGRIHRIIEEAGRRKSIVAPQTGLLVSVEASVNTFLATEGPKN